MRYLKNSTSFSWYLILIFFPRYEFFVQSEAGQKTTLRGRYDEANVTRVGETDVRYLIRDNYIALHDFSILQVLYRLATHRNVFHIISQKLNRA